LIEHAKKQLNIYN